METTTLTKLLGSIHIPCDEQQVIYGISDDSRRIERNWLFICRRGKCVDGTQFVPDVLAKGAIVLWEKEVQEHCYHSDDIERDLPILLNFFYRHPANYVSVIGVTGTNGKTSVTMILEQLFHFLNKESMVIGTGHIRYRGKVIETSNTTPSACILAYYVALARSLRIPYVIMEVSSHAIDQNRIGFLTFDFILYTNITKDHLDYHITQTHYRYTKFKLRNYLKHHGVLILNHDETYMHTLYDMSDKKIITFGQTQAHVQIHDIALHGMGSDFTLGSERYHTKMLGMVNVYNIVEALIVLHMSNIAVSQQKEAVAKLHGVAGRLEVHDFSDYAVWIDYAHTESSLYALLEFARMVSKGRVICVVGCGGERDHEKRPLMAQTALHFCDQAIFTADNPRGEPLEQILAEMVAQIHGAYEIYENRQYAIKYAMKIAQNNDIIVIAGKGDEEYQLVKGKKYTFSDRQWVKYYSRMEENII